MDGRMIGRVAGRVLVAGGSLVLLFVAYELWGTGIQTSRSQATLRTEFNTVLKQHGETPNSPTTSTPKPGAQNARETVPVVAAPPEGQPVGTITIPAIGLDMVVVQGTSTADLEQGPGHYPGTPLPGEAGNVAIAGHRTTYLHPFWDLNELGVGDRIVLTTLQGTFTYAVTKSLVVSPSDVGVAGPTRSPTLTLTTCTPRFSAADRLVVQASLTRSTIARSSAISTTTTTPATITTIRPATAATIDNDWIPPALWGMVVLASCAATYATARRLRVWRRRTTYALGTLLSLFPLFFFFETISRFLPASF